MQHSERDELIDRVRYGRLTPAEAEAEAAHLGLERLASRPDPSQFDPMRETWWTLPMAIAWIARRSPDEVRESWIHTDQNVGSGISKNGAADRTVQFT